MLILDGYANLAESDTVYTHNLMCKGKVDYKVKIILKNLDNFHNSAGFIKHRNNFSSLSHSKMKIIKVVYYKYSKKLIGQYTRIFLLV